MSWDAPDSGSMFQPPVPIDAGGNPQMMMDEDAGGKPPVTQPDSGPPPQFDAGLPSQPDSGQQSQPDASACQYKVNPLGGGVCGVQGACPGTGTSYQMNCTTANA